MEVTSTIFLNCKSGPCFKHTECPLTILSCFFQIIYEKCLYMWWKCATDNHLEVKILSIKFFAKENKIKKVKTCGNKQTKINVLLFPLDKNLRKNVFNDLMKKVIQKWNNLTNCCLHQKVFKVKRKGKRNYIKKMEHIFLLVICKFFLPFWKTFFNAHIIVYWTYHCISQ